MPLDLRNSIGQPPVTLEAVEGQLNRTSVVEWQLIGSQWVEVTPLPDDWLLVKVILPDDWEGSCMLHPDDRDLNGTIQKAYEDAITKKEGVQRARRYA